MVCYDDDIKSYILALSNQMGIFGSKALLPPNAKLREIKSKEIDGPMKFTPGLYGSFPVQSTAKIISTFVLEKKMHIQRVKRGENNTNDIIMSYTTENRDEIVRILKDLNIPGDLKIVDLPLWCPLSEKQRQECLKYWPVSLIQSQPTIEEQIDVHMSYIEKVIEGHFVIIADPEKDMIYANDVCDCTNCQGHIHHGIINALGKANQYSNTHDQYLCTGLTVYCYDEPCCMCTMGMVHSRVAKLIFIRENKDYGGICSAAEINSNPRINHRFRAFKVEF